MRRTEWAVLVQGRRVMRELRHLWKTLLGATELFFSKQSFQSSAALAFYTLFSMAPLLIIVIAVTGMVLGDEAARGELVARLDGMIGVDAAAMVQDAVQRSSIERSGIGPTLLGLAAVIFGATTVFAQLRASLNDFWDVQAQPSRHNLLNFLLTRLVSFGMVLTVGFLMLTSFLISLALATMMRYADELIPVPPLVVSLADAVVSLLVMTLLFGLIFRVLPDVHLSWRNVTRGAVFTSLLFMGGQYLISLYLTRAGPASTYGAAGSLVVVLMWVYYSTLILHFGVALTRAMLQEEGGQVRPSRGAVRIATEVVTEPESPDDVHAVRRRDR
jgi:membrane protein